MSNFAHALTTKIKASPAFWDDIELVFSEGIQTVLTNFRPERTEISEKLDGAIKRLVEVAYTFSQTESENDKNLAQGIALYTSLATSNFQVNELASDILVNIGNFPGVDHLNTQRGSNNPSLTSRLREFVLRSLNVIRVDDKDYFLTDFQKKVWSQLAEKGSTAISAPTSAGKSFLVLEHLCSQAIQFNEYTAVFIAPTRALLSEVYGKVSKKLETYNSQIRISAVPSLDSESRPKQIFVLTQERLQVLLATSDIVFDLVIVDEAQSIGDQSRGMILQDCLETIRARGSSTRFLFLAPGATGFGSLENAIGIDDIIVQKTDLSPVVQNRIVVQADEANPNKLNLSLLNESRKFTLGSYIGERGFENANTRLAAIALELGRNGGSLVYGTGPADAETVAGQIASGIKENRDSTALLELSKFIQQHVHKRYSLASFVLKGVAYHYGKMPSLLREALEEAFKNNDLNYLACTTTLFQGVNLPARNVFIDTPTRGNRGEMLDAASLWNFAGRAGRLGHDVCGNVFLVDYESWDEHPLDHRKGFSITPSFRSTVIEQFNTILEKLEGNEGNKNEPYSSADAAAGLLISRAARGTLSSFLQRTLADTLAKNEIDQLEEAASQAYEEIGLPAQVIATNWTVNPFGQARLLERFKEKIQANDFDDLIPLHPSGNVYRLYVLIFSRINKYVLQNNSSKFSNKLAATGLSWMNGKPLPAIIASALKYKESDAGTLRAGNIDSLVRGVFDFVEDTLRFKYVQLGRAYIDLLRFALIEAGHSESAKKIYDFPLALELGVSSTAGQAFIELGLSRITASVLENLIPDSAPTPLQAKEWLSNLRGNEFRLSRVILDELTRKGLMKIFEEEVPDHKGE